MSDKAERTLTDADVQTIAEAVSQEMLTLPRELGEFLEPNRTYWTNLDPLSKVPPLANVYLRIATDSEGLFIEFTAQGNQRLALLRFAYKGWAWHNLNGECHVCGNGICHDRP